MFGPYYWLTWSGLHLMPGKTNKTFYTLLPLSHEYLVEDYYCVAMNELNWFPADTEVSFYLLQCYCFKQYTLTKHQWSRVYNPGFYCGSSAANCLNLCKYWNVKQTMRIRVYNCGWIVHDYLFTSDCFCSFLLFNLIIKTIKQLQMIIEHCHQRMLLPQIVQ